MSHYIGIQEVEDGTWAHKVFGDDYDYYFTERNWAQRVGFAVRKTAGLKVRAVEYEQLNVGRVRKGLDITLSRNGNSVRLLGVHLKSGCFAKPLDSNSTSGLPKKLKKACRKLAMQVQPLESWVDARAAENLPFIILGDFNRRFEVEEDYSENSGLWAALDDDGAEDLTRANDDLHPKCWNGKYRDFIDHIVLDKRALQRYKAGTFNELVFKEAYSKRVSRAITDHCPISIEYDM